MTTLQRLRRALLIGALVAGGLAATAGEASATHFRYGSITWQVPNAAQPNVVKIRFDAAFRWSFAWGGGGSCPPGFVPTGPTGVGACPALNSVITGTVGQITIQRIPAGPAITPLQIALKVTSISPTEDWFTGTYEATVTLPSNPATANYQLEFRNNARISTLRDSNNDRDYVIRALVTVRPVVNQPPTVATLPVLTLALNQLASFPIAAGDPNGDAITFSISPAAETGLATATPSGFMLSPAGVVTWTPTVAGLYAVQVRVTDPIGAYTVADFILNVKPAVGQLPTVLLNGQATPQALTVVYGTPVSFTVSASDPENTPVLLSHGSLPPGAAMTPSLPLTAVNPAATFNWTPPQSAIGTYVMNFAGLDGDGRQDTNAFTLTVTGNPPTISCTTSPSPAEAASLAGAPITITANVDDPDDDQVTVRFLVDGVERQVSGLLPTPTIQTFTSVFGLGSHGYEVRAGDGLSSATCTGTFSVVDTTAPSIAVLPGNQTLPATGPTGAVATWTVASTDAVDPSPFVICSVPSGSSFPVGTTTVTCTAMDDSGNTSATSFTVTVLDEVPPVVTVPGDVSLEATGPGGATHAFAATAIDNVDGVVPVTCTPPSGWTFVLGTTAVECAATDASGNTGSASFQVTVVDTTAPTFAAPASITAEATGPAGAAVDYIVPTATDAVDLLTVVTCAPAPGTTFPLGTSEVSCSSTDNAGNTTNHSFQVTVQDTTAPEIAGQPDIVVAAEGPGGTVVPYPLPATTDAVSGPGTASCTPPPGSLFPLGTTPVACTATDGAGNLAGVTFTVTVFNTPPSFTPPADISQPATFPGGGVVHFTATGSDAEQGTIPAVCEPPSGSTFPIGTTTVICTVTDQVGASASGSFTVTVTNNPPTFTPPANITEEATGPAGATVSFIASGDDVEQGSIPAVCTPASGSRFPIGSTIVNCTVTDVAGASAAGSFTVTVVDSTAPTFDPGSLGPHTVLGACSGGNVSFPLPTATDGVSAVTVTCAALAGTSFGANAVLCTATDAAGNATQISVTVHVLQPLRVVFTPPLSDDNAANDVNTDADVANLFNPGQGIPHKVRLLGCTGSDLTTTVPVEAKLAVSLGANGGGPNLINEPADVSGIGSPDGSMVLTDGQYHFNLNTNRTEYPRGQDFRSLVTVTYSAAPGIVAGVEDARLRSR
jgi:hypothetical protein